MCGDDQDMNLKKILELMYVSPEHKIFMKNGLVTLSDIFNILNI